MTPIQMTITLEAGATAAICEAMADMVVSRLSSVMETAREAGAQSATSSDRGVALTKLDRVEAHELRAAYLLGKLPEDGALLIDQKEVSKMLGISPRTVYRLHQEKAMPNPVRVGRQARWRVRELVEWVEADCPPQRHWRYSDGQGKNSRKR